MTTTLREILRQFADNGDLDNEYVTLQEYEALKVKAGNMSQDKERDIISRDERIFELETENEALKAILQQWAEIGQSLFGTSQMWEKDLVKLITATKAVLGEYDNSST